MVPYRQGYDSLLITSLQPDSVYELNFAGEYFAISFSRSARHTGKHASVRANERES